MHLVVGRESEKGRESNELAELAQRAQSVARLSRTAFFLLVLPASPRPRDLSILVEHQQQHQHPVHVFTQHPALPVLIAQYVHQRRLDVARDHSATAASTPYAPTTSKGLL